MTVKDGFKLGIGYTLCRVTFGIICDMLDKKSSIRKSFDRCVAACTNPKTENEPTDTSTATVNNKIGFTID